jgi:hypothetical protein
MVECWYPYTPVVTNYPEEGKSGDPKKSPMGSQNQWEAKPSLNPQIEKQLTMGRVGKMTCSSTVLIPCPWSLCKSRLYYLELGGKSYFPAHTGTWSSTLPPATWPATFILKCQRNWHPSISRTQGSHCSMGNKEQASKTWLPCVCSNCHGFWQPGPASRPQSSHCLQALFPITSAAPVAPGSLHWQAGLRTPTAWRFGSPPCLKQLLWLLEAHVST